MWRDGFLHANDAHQLLEWINRRWDDRHPPFRLDSEAAGRLNRDWCHLVGSRAIWLRQDWQITGGHFVVVRFIVLDGDKMLVL